MFFRQGDKYALSDQPKEWTGYCWLCRSKMIIILNFLTKYNFLRIKITLEDECATTGFLLMADLTHMDEFLHPLTEDGLDKANGYAGMWKKTNYSTTILVKNACEKHAL